MRKQAIIGTGSWAKRLYEKQKNNLEIHLLNPRQEEIDLKGFESVVYCVPSKFFLDVHKKVINTQKIQNCFSCIKGLVSNGTTPLKNLRADYNASIHFLGGPNIDNGREVINFGDELLERISILKNIYAIGFGMMIKEYGINFASQTLLDYTSELKKNNGIIESQNYLLADLIATCFSEESRNRIFGENLANGHFKTKKLRPCGTIEGLHSAKIAKEYGLYEEYRFIQEIIKKLTDHKII